MFFNKIPSVAYHELPTNAVIIDVRERHEYQQHKLPRTKNVPLSQLDGFHSSKTVYVICASGARSKRAVKSLRKRNIDAINIRGGMMHIR